MSVQTRRYEVDPADTRAPTQEVWDAMTPEEHAAVLASLPSDPPRALLPEGDQHRLAKTSALDTLEQFFRRAGRRVYLSSELPVYYPGEAMFAPDVLAVLDVPDHSREHWTVSHEKRGLDFVLEVHVSGDARKDAERNVERYARLGIPEYFLFDRNRLSLRGFRLPPGARAYQPIVPQGGRYACHVLGLELAIQERRLRFLVGGSPLVDAEELIVNLEHMVDGLIAERDEERSRAEAEKNRADTLARELEALRASLEKK